MTTRDAVVLYQYTTETSVPAVGTGAPWPAGKLVVAPGNYFFDNNIAFDFTKEGCYAVWATDGTTYDAGNLIVFKTDVMLLMASLARVTGCGNADEGLTLAQQIDMARARAVWLRCGPTINLVKYWCGQFGIPCREVHFLTGNMPSTPGIDLTLDPHSGDVVDTGHVLIEVQVNGKWVLADVATDAAYKDAAGNWLSMGAVVAAGVANCTTVNLADPDFEQDNYSSAFSPGAYANITQPAREYRALAQGHLSDTGHPERGRQIYLLCAGRRHQHGGVGDFA
jgi:hypothetical protein